MQSGCVVSAVLNIAICISVKPRNPERVRRPRRPSGSIAPCNDKLCTELQVTSVKEMQLMASMTIPAAAQDRAGLRLHNSTDCSVV